MASAQMPRNSNSPAERRGFCIDPLRPERRVYLVPRGLSSGPSATRAAASGVALPLAGGPMSFDHVDVISRPVGMPAERRAARLSDLPAGTQGLIDGLTRPLRPFAGLSMHAVRIMGVINATPDSFSDGGEFADAEAAVAHACDMLAAGADILDIGGESTRPGAAPVSLEEELRRVIPTVEALADRGAVVSVDTRRAAVMRRAVEAGARIINDVTALTGDKGAEMAVAGTDASIVLMHMQGDPTNMQKNPRYADATCDLLDYFDARLQRLSAIGIDLSRIAIDPGIGFGKLDQHNLLILDELAAFQVFGCPILLGVSRKSFIARLSRQEPPKQRLAGTLAANQIGIDRGVRIVRVHDAAEAAQARAIWQAVAQREEL
jgi:dihydropteroate synthase